ncbi:hypothetical protein RFI_34716, partial [Reticulomyxa filosa]
FCFFWIKNKEITKKNNNKKVYKGYMEEYELMKQNHPYFGILEAPVMETKTWWKKCDMTMVMKTLRNSPKIYALFGSKESYMFPDDLIFFDIFQKIKHKLGVIINDSERYRLSILGKLNVFLFYFFIYCNQILIQLLFFFLIGLKKCVAIQKRMRKKTGFEDVRYAKRVGCFEFNEGWVHVGDNYIKDIIPVNALGGNAILSN